MVSLSLLINQGLLITSQDIYLGLAAPNQASIEQYNIIKYLGGQGPYIQNPGFGISTEIPDGCEIEQVHLLSRHGERYPSRKSYKGLHDLYEKFQSYDSTFKGQLSFLNDYKFFITDINDLEKETTPLNSEGIFTGSMNAMKHGSKFRAKYKSLYEEKQRLPVFSSNSGRVHQTSEYFARGFFGDEYKEDKVEYVILNETKSMGANSLTPRYACAAYDEHANDDYVSKFSTDYLSNAAKRFRKQNPGLVLDEDEVSSMFSWCAYEINVKGTSPMCSVFTNDEYIKYSYAYDLSNYYSHGPGNNMTKVIGAPLVNATVTLLNENDSKNRIYVSFTHDTDLEIYLASLGLLEREEQEDLPIDYVLMPHLYVHSSIVPQGARLYTEKLKCAGKYYVRFILNDAVIPLPGISSGPGFSTPLNNFNDYIQNRLKNVDFAKQCHALRSLNLTFYWDYQSKKYTAPLINS